MLLSHRFIDRGEFGEVYQGNAVDILGPETGPTPVAVKVIHKNYYCVCGHTTFTCQIESPDLPYIRKE